MKPDKFYACVGKFKFPSKPAAEKVARLSSGRKSRPVGVYRCTECQHWHTGQSIKKRRKEGSD